MAKKVISILRTRGYRINVRRKKLSVNNKDYEVLIHVVRSKAKPTAVFMPDYVSPHRPYPVFVYIFAIAIYELAPKTTQRLAAEITRKTFGLGANNFSASTLCRTRKKLIESGASIIDALKNGANGGIADNVQPETPEEFEELINEGAAGIADIYGRQHSLPGTGTPDIKEVLAAFPGLAEFISKTIMGDAQPYDKASFAALAGMACRKYYLWNRRLII